jgi:hypothetical protein
VGSVINIEDRGIVDSLRRSVQLVRPHLWVACVVIALPMGIELGIEDWFLSFAHAAPWVAVVVVSVILSLTTRAMISLLEVILGHSLIHGSQAVTAIM